MAFIALVMEEDTNAQQEDMQMSKEVLTTIVLMSVIEVIIARKAHRRRHSMNVDLPISIALVVVKIPLQSLLDSIAAPLVPIPSHKHFGIKEMRRIV